MNYIKIKNILKKYLPRSFFNLLIIIWRFLIIKPIQQYQKLKIINFKKACFKQIEIGKHKYILKIDPQNGYVDEVIYRKGIYEREIYNIMLTEVNKNDVCLDIGANIGMYTNFLPLIVGNKGKVIAFEPIKRIYEQNIESISKNNYKNVDIYNYALSNKESKVNIYINNDNVGGSSLVKENNLSNNSHTELIQTKIGDELLKKEAKIDFIKIDTEGFELNVLEGLKNTIKNFKPKMIIEFSPKLFLNLDDGIKILKLLSNYYQKIKVIEYNLDLDLSNPNDLKKFNNLINEKQVNLFLYNK